jgi:hypothetical protein
VYANDAYQNVPGSTLRRNHDYQNVANSAVITTLRRDREAPTYSAPLATEGATESVHNAPGALPPASRSFSEARPARRQMVLGGTSNESSSADNDVYVNDAYQNVPNSSVGDARQDGGAPVGNAAGNEGLWF